MTTLRDATDAEAVVRRTQVADGSTIGVRGMRTRQRILDAALEVFGEFGYDRATLDQVGKVAGCSRASVYQYFTGKEELFRHLAQQLARQFRASTEMLDSVTADSRGVGSLRAWLAVRIAIQRRYAPVIRAFDAASAGDEKLVHGAKATAERNLAIFLARVEETSSAPRELEALTQLLLASVTRAIELAADLANGAGPPTAGPFEAGRVADALAQFVHRALFGTVEGVNDSSSTRRRFRALPLSDALGATFAEARALEAEAEQSGRQALAAMLAAAPVVISGRGYLGIRVDDVVTVAGVSHGAFYRYFTDIDSYIRLAVVGAIAELSDVLDTAPDGAGARELRRWLRGYRTVHVDVGPMIRVWVEAAESSVADRAAVIDWGRRRLARVVQDRRFGDPDVDPLMMLAIVETFGADTGEAPDADTAVRLIRRGAFGVR